MPRVEEGHAGHFPAYQPQQSVLKPQFGQRHTACIRNISACPHRSQTILSRWPLEEAAAGASEGGPAVRVDEGFSGSAMPRIIAVMGNWTNVRKLDSDS